ncbi:MAG: Ig domain-containing protein [Candidatus Brocadiia bacterium]
MPESRSIRLAMAGLLALSLSMTFGGCSEKKPMLPGGGEHKVIQLFIRAYSKEASAKDKGPVTLRVGERLQLRAMAAWAIPSITEETERAAWTVSDPAVGDMDKDAVFTARKAGRTVVTAVIRVSEDGAGEVLGPEQTASGPVKTFSDELELNVREAAAAAPEQGATK